MAEGSGRPLHCPLAVASHCAAARHAQGLQDQHAKVRWAACQALGQMCTDLGPDLQSILPGLMAVMDDFSQPRVQVPLRPHMRSSVAPVLSHLHQTLNTPPPRPSAAQTAR